MPGREFWGYFEIGRTIRSVVTQDCQMSTVVKQSKPPHASACEVKDGKETKRFDIVAHPGRTVLAQGRHPCPHKA